MDKHEVSKILNDIGLLLEIQGESFFKSKSYYDASRTLEFPNEDQELLVLEDRLKEIKEYTLKYSKLIHKTKNCNTNLRLYEFIFCVFFKTSPHILAFHHKFHNQEKH